MSNLSSLNKWRVGFAIVVSTLSWGGLLLQYVVQTPSQPALVLPALVRTVESSVVPITPLTPRLRRLLSS